MEKVFLITGFIEDLELLVINDEMITALGNVLNDSISLCVRNFFDTVDRLGYKDSKDIYERRIYATKCRMENLIGEKVKKFSFHAWDLLKYINGVETLTNRFMTQAENKRRLDFIRKLSCLRPDTALTVIDNYVQASADIDWILENEKYWVANIPVRVKADFAEFEIQMGYLNQCTTSIKMELGDKLPEGRYLGIPDMHKVLTANKSFFYNPNEKPVYTAMAGIITNSQNLKIIQHGLHYDISSRDKGISQSGRISLNF